MEGPVILLALALAAEPEIDARAREIYDNGVILYEEGRYEDAIYAWEEAWKLSPRPLLLFNIANAQERLGHYEAAMDTLGRYRALAPAGERETLDRRIRNIEARIAEIAALPVVAPPVVLPTPAPRRPSRALPLALGGAGLAGMAAGAVFGAQALSAREEAAGACVLSGSGSLCMDGDADLLLRDRRASLAADLSFGIGTLALGGSVATWLLGVPVAITPTTDGGFLTVQGTLP